METGKGRTARDRESGPDRSGVFYTQKSLRRHEQRDTAVGKYKASVVQPKSGRALNLEREDNCRTSLEFPVLYWETQDFPTPP